MPEPVLAEIAYGDLRKCSEQYEAEKPVREVIEDFYRGGFALQAKAKQYLPKLVGEHPRRHADRCQSGAYINYFAQIVDYYASALFAQDLSVRPAADADKTSTAGTEPSDNDVYSRFARDADGRGASLNDVLHDIVVTALKHGRAWLHVELPPPVTVQSRAEEDDLGLGVPYVFEVPSEQLIDWDHDDDGDLSYAVLHQAKQRKAPPGRRTDLQILEEFKVWRKIEAIPDAPDVAAGFERDPGDDVAGCRIVWEKYEIAYPNDKKPKDSDPVRLVARGEVSFQRIPILEFALPEGLWIGNKLGPLVREHYQRRTTLNAAENRSMVAIPVAKLGSEIGAVGGELPSEAQQNPNRGQDPVSAFMAKGYEVIGADDALEFVEPHGHCYELVAKRITDLKEEIFRISHQLAASISTGAGAMRRSGASKSEDRAAEALVLGAIGGMVRRFGALIYTTISVARGEDVVWAAHGLDTYEARDRQELIAEATQMANVPVPSQTFDIHYKTQVATQLCPGMDPATQDTVRSEIAAGVAAEYKANGGQKRPSPPTVPQRENQQQDPVGAQT